jgi:hypothetical protein
LGNFKGFAELRVPGDLTKKLEHDLRRILESPTDEYAAFDFFVTAEHLVDWVHPADYAARKLLRTDPLLRITSHIANGVKHFQTLDTRHRSVESVRRTSGVFAEGIFARGIYAEGSLVVHLTDEEQAAFGQESIRVDALAKRVFEFWSAHAPTTSPLASN